MQTAETQITLASAGVAALINIVVGALFDIPPTTVLVVFIGTFIGLVFRPTVTMPSANKDKFWLLAKTCGWLIAITMLASWAVPWVTHLLPGVAQKSMAAALGFVGMLKREKIGNFIAAKIMAKEE